MASCDTTVNATIGQPNNDFTPIKAYVLGPLGEELTEISDNGGA